MDVDCSRITYDTPPSTAILGAVERAKLAGITQQTEPLGKSRYFNFSLDLVSQYKSNYNY